MCEFDIGTKEKSWVLVCVCEYAALHAKLQTRKMHYLFISSFLRSPLKSFLQEVLIVIALKWFYMNVLRIIYTAHLIVHSWEEMILNAFISSSLFYTWMPEWMSRKSVMLKLNIILNSFGIIRYGSCGCWYIVDRLLELLCCGF
jgi:hypothetical protein